MIVLDYRDKRPIYEQIVEKLQHLIICGALESNAKMPSVRALAMELSVNPNTIQRAYAQLEQDGYLYTIMGRGNYVTSEPEWKSGKISDTLAEVSSLLQKAREIGVTKQALLEVLNQVYQEDILTGSEEPQQKRETDND